MIKNNIGEKINSEIINSEHSNPELDIPHVIHTVVIKKRSRLYLIFNTVVFISVLLISSLEYYSVMDIFNLLSKYQDFTYKIKNQSGIQYYDIFNLPGEVILKLLIYRDSILVLCSFGLLVFLYYTVKSYMFNTLTHYYFSLVIFTFFSLLSSGIIYGLTYFSSISLDDNIVELWNSIDIKFLLILYNAKNMFIFTTVMFIISTTLLTTLIYRNIIDIY